MDRIAVPMLLEVRYTRPTLMDFLLKPQSGYIIKSMGVWPLSWRSAALNPRSSDLSLSQQSG